MSQLLLNSLEIKNFRAFDHLQIPRLGRVNLFTGKNNVGKTSILEALRLYASGSSISVLRDLLNQRDELLGTDLEAANIVNGYSSKPSLSTRNDNVCHLFHGRGSVYSTHEAIEIGPSGNRSNSISIELALYQYAGEEDNEGEPKLTRIDAGTALVQEDVEPYLLIRSGDTTRRIAVSRFFSRTFSEASVGLPIYRHQFVKSNGLDASQISRLWDRIQLTELEKHVVEALRVITPSVERVSVRTTDERIRTSVPIIRMTASDDVFPLKSLGDGINRLFGLTLALVNTEGGIFLIDEVENGLHYSVMPDVWRLIFTVAKQLNIQVFATTHSYDCIKAFDKAASRDEEEGMLVRIENRNGQFVVTPFDEELLEVVASELIEVR